MVLALLPVGLVGSTHITTIKATLSWYKLNGQPRSTGSAPQPARSSMSHVVALSSHGKVQQQHFCGVRRVFFHFFGVRGVLTTRHPALAISFWFRFRR